MKLSTLLSEWGAYLAKKNPHSVTTTQTNVYAKTEVAPKLTPLVTQRYLPFLFFSRNKIIPAASYNNGRISIGQGEAEYNTITGTVPATTLDVSGVSASTGWIYLAVTDNGFVYTLSDSNSSYKNVMRIGTWNKVQGTAHLAATRKVATTEIVDGQLPDSPI
ncbi:hypothetical protein R8O82_001207 [Escherichia coli]|nr:hypothetical protein [Escherichia coli]